MTHWRAAMATARLATHRTARTTIREWLDTHPSLHPLPHPLLRVKSAERSGTREDMDGMTSPSTVADFRLDMTGDAEQVHKRKERNDEMDRNTLG
jgi:hypothetical protein